MSIENPWVADLVLFILMQASQRIPRVHPTILLDSVAIICGTVGPGHVGVNMIRGKA